MFLALLLLLIAAPAAAVGAATYDGLQAGRFMKDWLILKPIPVTESEQKKAFGEDRLAPSRVTPGAKVTIAGKEYEWHPLESPDDIVDLRKGSTPSDFAIAYAWAEIEMPATGKGLLGIGSDDGVKIWLNGKLIHQNWASRSTHPDDDVVPVAWQRGKNQLLLKIQNIQGSWGFACRLMGPREKADKLISEAGGAGDIDAVKRLLDAGPVDINALNKSGLSAVHAARMKGNAGLAAYLVSRGANVKIGRPAPETLTDKHFSGVVGKDDPGVAVLVAQNGKVLFEKGYGMADVEHGLAVTPQTKFRIGSITKQFTATLILKLQEEGKLSVTDKLSKYIPDFPRGGEVTLTHLLTHTSGIHGYTERPGFMETVTKPITTVELVNLFKNDPYDFDPGTKWRYDNSGYALLTYIIEKVTGGTYSDFLQKTLLTPLGMTNTGVHHSDAELQNVALGYQYKEGKFSRAVNWDMSRASGAGSIYSTVEDLFKWSEAVFNGKVLSEASLKAAFTPVKVADNIESGGGYGFGWFLGTLRGSQEIQHSGGLPGFSSYLMRLPKEKFTVVVLANSEPCGPGVQPGALANETTGFYLGERLAPRATNKVNSTISSKALDAITGLYDYGQAVLRVTVDEGKVYAQLSGQPKVEIFPKSETEFFWKVVDAQITFVKDENGKVVKALHHQGGQTINAPRMDVFKMDTASLDAILGKYDYGGGKAILTVTRDGDQVYAQLTGQPKFDIYPKSATEFYWKVVDAQVTFVKEFSGRVTRAVHHQNGATIDAPKL
jgi:CubicO group peptidase (beta-lactamase class C family)/uncharacterized pyridoxamine 5'-phosphate oxidase family protein